MVTDELAYRSVTKVVEPSLDELSQYGVPRSFRDLRRTVQQLELANFRNRRAESNVPPPGSTSSLYAITFHVLSGPT